jgi:hypothetical protein
VCGPALLAGCLWLALNTTGVARPAAKPKAVECTFSGAAGAPVTDAERLTALLHANNAVFRLHDRNCDGELDAAEAGLFAEAEKRKLDYAVTYLRNRDKAGRPLAIDAKGVTAVAILATPEPLRDGNDPGMAIFLRRSLADIGVFQRPIAAPAAAGARFSMARNKVTDNTIWNAEGVAGAIFVGYGEADIGQDTPYLAGLAVAPTLAFRRIANSNPSYARGDVDVLNPAATIEAAFGQTLGGMQYLRARAGYITSFSGETGSWSAAAEWQPIWIGSPGSWLPFDIGSPNPLGLARATWEIDPVFVMRYDQQVTGETLPLFAERDDALRLGVDIGLSVLPFHGEDIGVPEWLQKASLKGSYGYLYDTLSGRETNYWTAGATFNLDPEGHIALDLNYKRGRDSDTGIRSDLATLGLALKY